MAPSQQTARRTSRASTPDPRKPTAEESFRKENVAQNSSDRSKLELDEKKKKGLQDAVQSSKTLASKCSWRRCAWRTAVMLVIASVLVGAGGLLTQQFNHESARNFFRTALLIPGSAAEGFGAAIEMVSKLATHSTGYLELIQPTIGEVIGYCQAKLEAGSFLIPLSKYYIVGLGAAPLVFISLWMSVRLWRCSSQQK